MTAREAAKRVRSLPPEDVTVSLWLTGWQVFFPSERNEETAAHDDAMLGPFIERHGRKLLSAVTPLMAQQWAVAHPSQVRYLRRVWDKAVMMQLVSFNVWKCVELPKRTRPQRPVPTVDELDSALANARALGGWWLEFADLVEVTAFTGARQGGVCSLRRPAVDLEGRRLTLTEKGQKTRTVVLAGRALEAMSRQMGRSGESAVASRLVWRSLEGRPLTRFTVGTYWRAIRGDFDGPFHTLKHFAGTWLAQQGVDERDIAVQLGHFDSMGRPYTALVRKVYVHPDHSEALERIERTVVA